MKITIPMHSDSENTRPDEVQFWRDRPSEGYTTMFLDCRMIVFKNEVLANAIAALQSGKGLS